MTQTTALIDFTRIKNDINGNPRFVCHFFNFLTQPEIDSYGIENYNQLYSLALSRSRQLGGRKFHNKQYGGGIAFHQFAGSLEQMSERIKQIQASFETIEAAN